MEGYACGISSHEQKQKGDLERQNGRVLAYCVKKKYQVVKSYEEVGSGMCDTRPKLHQLFKMVENKEVDKVVVEHKDRLTRFNFNFLAAFFASHGVEVVHHDRDHNASVNLENVAASLSET